MRNFNSALLAFCLLGLCAPAMAAGTSASEVRRADDEVAYRARLTRIAVQSGDAATIAAERAKLQAAKARAWGKRNPAKPPVPRAAAN